MASGAIESLASEIDTSLEIAFTTNLEIRRALQRVENTPNTSSSSLYAKNALFGNTGAPSSIRVFFTAIALVVVVLSILLREDVKGTYLWLHLSTLLSPFNISRKIMK